MLVKDLMTASVVTIREDQTMLEARELLRGKGLTSLPVVDDIDRVRGIITLDDVGKASPTEGSTLSRYEANYLLGRLKVRDVMSRNVITVNDDDTMEYVAFQLYKNKVHALPVVDGNNRLCGIASQTDLFRSFVEMMGMSRSCMRITIAADDKVGFVADVTALFKENNVNIISLISHGNAEIGAELIVRAEVGDGGLAVVESLREAGYNVTDIMSLQGLE